MIHNRLGMSAMIGAVCAIAAGGVSAAATAEAIVAQEKANAHTESYKPHYPPAVRGNGREKSRVAQNQRQRRKDARRAHAAGNKKAFY